MANSYVLACASGVEWVPLEYSSMSNARRERLAVYLDRSQFCACNKGIVLMLCLVYISLHDKVNRIIPFKVP